MKMLLIGIILCSLSGYGGATLALREFNVDHAVMSVNQPDAQYLKEQTQKYLDNYPQSREKKCKVKNSPC